MFHHIAAPLFFNSKIRRFKDIPFKVSKFGLLSFALD